MSGILCPACTNPLHLGSSDEGYFIGRALLEVLGNKLCIYHPKRNIREGWLAEFVTRLAPPTPAIRCSECGHVWRDPSGPAPEAFDRKAFAVLIEELEKAGELSTSGHTPDIVKLATMAASVNDLNAELKRYREHIAWTAQTVHQAAHVEGTWDACPLVTCEAARRVLRGDS